MTITKCTSTTNTTYKKNRAVKYIVLHYTAGTTSKAGTATSTAKYFASGKAGGSADFIVDDETMVQYNGDIKNRYCWAVGGSKYSTMATKQGGKYYNVCTNWNSISIEMCSCKTNTKSLLASDTDWYLTDKTVANAVELTKYLMKLYNVPVENVIMHHQVTGKICPNPWCVNESRLSGWNSFKARLTGTTTTTTTATATKAVEEKSFKFVEATVLGKACKFTGFAENNENWIKATAALEAIGYTAKWNSTKKRVIAVKSGKETLLDIRTYISTDNVSFCPLRELFEYLGYSVVWDAESKVISVKK